MSQSMTVLHTFLAAVDSHNARLNDPRGDGSGHDAEAPTGDDYNALLDLVEALRGAADPLAEAVAALRVIYAGATASGRWLACDTGDAVGHDPAKPDDGYYDSQTPPEGFDAQGWIGTAATDTPSINPLQPCEWESYTAEEQTEWIGTCAERSQHALERIGVPLVEEADPLIDASTVPAVADYLRSDGAVSGHSWTRFTFKEWDACRRNPPKNQGRRLRDVELRIDLQDHLDRA